MIFGALNWAVQWYQPPTQTAAKRSAKAAPQTTTPKSPERASLDDLTDAALALFLRDPT
jgi:hypothetical protein